MFKSEKRPLGSIGILIDGVEISSPESRDKVYSGPIDEFEVLNGGKDYDVINPPKLLLVIQLVQKYNCSC